MLDARLAGWNHLSPDLPGYGKSPWLEQPFTLTDHAEHIIAWLRSEATGPVVLVGHSMGGVIGTLVAEAAPELVRAFVSVDGNLGPEDCIFSGGVARQTKAEFLRTGMADLLGSLYSGGHSARDLRGYFVSACLCNPEAYYTNSIELWRDSARLDLASRLAALNCPHLYLLGSPQPKDEASRQLLDAAAVNWEKVAPAGHWPYVDQPRLFVDKLAAFLKTLTVRPARGQARSQCSAELHQSP